MKTGLSLSQLAAELERQQNVKNDYLADTRRLGLTGLATSLDVEGQGSFPMTTHAKRQLAEKLAIPATFYDRLEEKHPDILCHTVNRLLSREPQQTMVRVLDGRARAVLSSAFRPLDNYDLAVAVMPALHAAKAVVESCQITETRMYIKGTIPGLDRMLAPPEGAIMGQGHTIFPRALRGAFSITNSDVGCGRLVIAPAMLEKACTNLMTFKDDGYGAIHLGKRKGEDDGVREYFSDETKHLEDAAIWAKVRDVIAAICSGKVMDKLVDKLSAAREDAITSDLVKVVEVVAKRENLSDTERGGLLTYLVQSGEPTRYGLQWAVTRLSQDAEDYDRASDLERLGGKVIELPKSDWQEIMKRAA